MRAIMIKLRATLALGALGLTIASMAPSPAQATTSVTATEDLNARSAPDATAEVVGALHRGQTVTALGSTDGWTKIRIATTTAYVNSAYLSQAEDLPAEVEVKAAALMKTTTEVNLREGPGISYAVLEVLPEGTVVTTTGKASHGYAEVIDEASTGWVSAQYLTSAGNALPAITGTRVATAALDIRTTSGADAKTVAEVKKGTILSVTGAIQNGRAQIIFEKDVRWVTAKYLATPDTNLPAPPKLPKITGTRYATTGLNIRSTYKDKYKLITEVPKGTKISITSVVKQGRRQIVFENAVRWVNNKYLAKKKPKAGVGTGDAYAVEKGLKPNAIKVHRAILAEFPEITVFGGVRPDPIPDHPSGRALDVMIPNYKSQHGKDLGLRLSRWARTNADTLGINYVIWNQHIWNDQRSAEGWRYMASRGSDSANHKNHVHITVYAKGYSPA